MHGWVLYYVRRKNNAKEKKESVWQGVDINIG